MKVYYVTPSYFHPDSETLVFVSSTALTQFLNYSEYKCEVTTKTFKQGVPTT